MFALPKYGEGICLGRLAALLALLEIDRDRLQARAITVCGSNGKGSTAAFTAAIGRAYGLRTGLFTSPHLYRFNERFQIDGAPITRWEDVTEAVRAADDRTIEVVVERDGRFLMVEESGAEGRVLNQPAGHWEPGETLVEACVRETLEESAYRFVPTALVGVYRWHLPSAPDAPEGLLFAVTIMCDGGS